MTYQDEPYEDEEVDRDDDWQDDFDYDDYIDQHHSDQKSSTSIHPFWRLVAFILVTLFLLSIFGPLLGW